MVPRVSETGRTGGALTRPDLPGKKITLSTTAPGPYCKAFLSHSHTRPACTAVPVPFPFPRLPGSSCHSPLPPPPTPTDSAYTLRETNDRAAAERGACPAHKPQGWVTYGVAMAATTHPSVFALFCLRPAFMASQMPGVTCLCPHPPQLATFILSSEK